MKKQYKRIFFLLYLLLGMELFALQGAPQYQYLSPRPDALHVSREATIIVRLNDYRPKALQNPTCFITLEGSLSGPLTGVTKIASDGKTIIFQPDQPFASGEKVTVMLHPQLNTMGKESLQPLGYSFEVSSDTDASAGVFPDEKYYYQPINLSKSTAAGMPSVMPNGVSVPSDFPHIDVLINDDPGEGYIFLNNRGRGTPYNIIFDNDGSPVWYLRTSDRRRDFKVQRNGTITMLARDGGHRFLNFDENFNPLREYSAVDGYSTDEHECVIDEKGHVLLIGRHNTDVDMSQYVSGGKKNCSVRETIVQEFTPEGDKIFEWRAWDHFDPADILGFCDPGQADPRSNSLRFTHMNAIDIDDDGHIVLSSRHLSEVTKINRNTGEIIWRLGGANNEFEFVNDELDGFYMQHSVLALGDNHYSVFDNGNLHDPPRSRGVEYVLDLDKKTATLVWEYRNPQGSQLSHYMGNHQRLPSGNSLINWAIRERPKATEVTPDGEVVYEMNWAAGDECYRAFRFPWDGVVEKPSLFAELLADRLILVFNKFGDDNVAYYNIYGGRTGNPTTVIDTSKATLKTLTDLENGKRYYFRVTAVDNNGRESTFSNQVQTIVHILEPGQNLVPNGDFSRGRSYWNFELQGEGAASWNVVDGVSVFDIKNGGSPHHNVQLRQNNFPLIQGKTYRFEFDAWADAPKTINAKVGQDESPYTNYSRIGLSALARSKKHFVYEFEMEYPSDGNGRVVFNVGESDDDVYLDNVSLKLLDESEIEDIKTDRPDSYILYDNYPNPFNASTTLPFSLPKAAQVRLEVYDLLGRLQDVVMDREMSAGYHQVPFDASRLGSGVYFYRIKVYELDGSMSYTALNKMMMVK